MTSALTSPAPRKARGIYKKSKLVRGVGTNDADYPVCVSANINGRNVTLWFCPHYNVWSGMLRRAYSRNFHARCPTYLGCSVVPEWHTFSVFRAWMVTQPWEGNQLDKDILAQGNKVYGPDTCVFVSGGLNKFMNDHAASRGPHPLGVSWSKKCGMLQVRCNNPRTGVGENLGLFDAPNEAHLAWATRKLEHAKALAAEQTDPRVAKALIDRFTAKYEAALDTLTAGA